MQPEPAASEHLFSLLVGAGHLARAQGRLAQAQQLFEQLQLAFPDRASPWLGLALLEIDRHDYARAAGHCRAALAVAPGYPLATAWLGVCQFALNENSSAICTLRSVRSEDSPVAHHLAETMLALIAALDRA
jgi:Flp pilus assembly protein TadD